MKASFIEPMLCVPTSELPSGPEWSYELKLDGYRGLAIKAAQKCKLLSRNGKDLSDRFPEITWGLEHLPDDTVIDGEIVALNAEGLPSFSLLQNSSGRDHSIVFYAFDVMLLAGEDLKGLRLEARRQMLRTKLLPKLVEPIRSSETFDVSADELIRVIRERGLEGVIAKRRDSLYEPGRRSGVWRKMRVNRGQEFVIGGYVPTSDNFDSILVGYYDGKDLMYAARVRAGFLPAVRSLLLNRFRGLNIERCPFKNLPEARKGRWGEGLTAEDMSQCRWLRPRLVCAVEYVEWTETNHLRHAKFIALREDKAPRLVVRESP
jgi:DNA ligase D-like protein (predicted ligase)